MKLTKKKIPVEVLKKLPVYYHDLKIIETEGLSEFIETQNVNTISVKEMNEPIHFPSLYHKPISKI